MRERRVKQKACKRKEFVKSAKHFCKQSALNKKVHWIARTRLSTGTAFDFHISKVSRAIALIVDSGIAIIWRLQARIEKSFSYSISSFSEVLDFSP